MTDEADPRHSPTPLPPPPEPKLPMEGVDLKWYLIRGKWVAQQLMRWPHDSEGTPCP